MTARDVGFSSVESGQLQHSIIRFNKRAANPGSGHANVNFAPGRHVQGLLYRLSHPAEIRKLDVFESTPRNYSREKLWIQTQHTRQVAWVYIANRAVIDENLKPERWYMNHLLAGSAYLSSEYFAWLQSFDCIDHDPQDRPLHL